MHQWRTLYRALMSANDVASISVSPLKAAVTEESRNDLFNKLTGHAASRLGNQQRQLVQALTLSHGAQQLPVDSDRPSNGTHADQPRSIKESSAQILPFQTGCGTQMGSPMCSMRGLVCVAGYHLTRSTSLLSVQVLALRRID